MTIKFDLINPGTILHNCVDHNPPLAPNLPHYVWTKVTPMIYRWEDDRVIPEDKQRYYPARKQIFHVMKNMLAGSHSPTESDCDVVATDENPVSIWSVHRSEGLRILLGYKIEIGPSGTKNKYLITNKLLNKSADDYWVPDYIGLGKFKDYGYFLDQSEALRYHNEMLYKDISVIQEKIAENNTWLFHLKEQDTPFVDVYNSGCPCCGYPRCDHNHGEPSPMKMTKTG